MSWLKGVSHALMTVLLLALSQTDSGFVTWTGSELAQRNETLGTRIGEDGSARETLADYGLPSGSHRFQLIRQDRDGRPAQHDAIDDIVYFQSGRATVRVGGTLLDRSGDMGSAITGGSRYPVAAGDVLRIPAGVPHAYIVPDGGHVTYLLVRVPAFDGDVVEDPDGEAPRLEPTGFALWRASELEMRDRVLGTKLGPDGSARETLADFGAGGRSHRFRFIRRDTDGPPELHEDIIDVVLVQSGAATLLVGGDMIGESNVIGARIEGGTQQPVAAGDVLHIPARTPHGYLVPEGGHITYLLVRVPASSTSPTLARAWSPSSRRFPLR